MTTEKLKTLKDLNEEFRKENIPQRRSGDEFNDLWEETLKREAIKWVKDDLRRIKQGNINLNILLRRWQVRFNLTNEDLK